MMVGAALVASAATAAADTADDAFIARLAAIGFIWPLDHAPAVISLGHHICMDRSNGWTSDQIAPDVHSIMSEQGFTFGDVTAIVNAENRPIARGKPFSRPPPGPMNGERT
jgi:hypothetical protein